jgi:hypothetical protein
MGQDGNQVERARDDAHGQGGRPSPDLDFEALELRQAHAGVPRHVLADHQLGVVVLRRRLQAAGGVHGVADRGQRPGPPVPHLADDDRPDVDANADPQWVG